MSWLSSLFKKPKRQYVPPPPAPMSIRGMLDPSVMRKSEDIRRKMMARVGRQGTILTGLGGQQQQLGLVG
ncbi:MAG: hypothetical protein GY832_11680 [Chloroflexi bacterium]|nr:hypothetical protein [Chloroflexota bacterium]